MGLYTSLVLLSTGFMLVSARTIGTHPGNHHSSVISLNDLQDFDPGAFEVDPTPQTLGGLDNEEDDLFDAAVDMDDLLDFDPGAFEADPTPPSLEVDDLPDETLPIGTLNADDLLDFDPGAY